VEIPIMMSEKNKEKWESGKGCFCGVPGSPPNKK
jgi:hypothetical protein